MDFGKVLSRAWEITWRWKSLWVLGFLAALGSGSAGQGSSSVDSSRMSDSYAMQVSPGIISLLVGLACVAILIGIAIWVVSIIARGGLIAGVNQIEDEGSTTLGQAWRAGAARFWTLFGIAVLAAIPIIVLIIGGFFLFGIMIAGGFALVDVSEGGSIALIVSSLLCGGVLCCGMIFLSIILAQVRLYAERAAMLEGLGWLDAFERGWTVIKKHLGPTIILWLIFFAIGLVLVVLIFAIMFPVLLPIAAIFSSNTPGYWMVAPVLCGGFLALIVGGLIGAIAETFGSATWTLAYRELTGLAVQPVIDAVAE